MRPLNPLHIPQCYCPVNARLETKLKWDPLPVNQQRSMSLGVRTTSLFRLTLVWLTKERNEWRITLLCTKSFNPYVRDPPMEAEALQASSFTTSPSCSSNRSATYCDSVPSTSPLHIPCSHLCFARLSSQFQCFRFRHQFLLYPDLHWPPNSFCCFFYSLNFHCLLIFFTSSCL